MSVLLFLVGVYGTTWTLCLMLRGAAGAGSWSAMLAFLFGTVWAPTAFAIVLTLLLDGGRSCVDLLRRLFSVPRNVVWLAVAVAIPAATISIAVLIARALGHSAPWAALTSLPSIVGFQVVTGATGEELGW